MNKNNIICMKQYGSLEDTRKNEGEYSVAIHSDELHCDHLIDCSTESTTLASSESELLLEQYYMDALQHHQEVKQLECTGFMAGTLHLLGFKTNPLSSLSNHDATTTTTTTTTMHSRNNAAADMRLAMLSNFSTAYNIVSISLALHLMQQQQQQQHDFATTTTTTTSTNNTSICSSALIAGMIMGQLVGGTLGDIMGRHLALTIVMFLQVMGAVMTSLSCTLVLPGGEYEWNIYSILAFWRFVLGIGAGGVYPLAATITSESSQSCDERCKSVALAFSMQGVGYVVVPMTAWILIEILGETSDLTWRLLLGFGALPGILLTMLRVMNRRSERNATQQQEQHIHSTSRAAPVSIIEAILAEPDLIRKMMGTGGCWFLFDILFYGNTLFQPLVLSSAFGTAETVQNVARDTTLIACVALPGYIVSVAAVGRQSPRFIQLQGFLSMGILYAFIGCYFDYLAGNRWLLLSVYSATFFWSNYGPNATTFMLPSMTFSKSCRSTLNGVCAACGKVGALIGTIVFVPMAAHFGNAITMLTCAAVSFTGLMLTYACVAVHKTDVVETDDALLQHLTVAERIKVEQRLSKVPMKVVFSNPSLFDWNES